MNSTGRTIVCLGDSITHGYGASPDKDYPSILSERLGRPVVNAGVNGDTTSEALRRLERDVLAKDPWIVIVELGGNDLLQQVSGRETRENLDRIVQRCLDSGAIVVLVHCKFGILFSDPYWETHQEISEERGTALVRNALRGILGNRSRMSDRVHPNDAGYALLAERVAKVVGDLADASEVLRR